jgi:hypothetical protein
MSSGVSIGLGLRSCTHTCTPSVNAEGSLIVDSTDFRSGDNENAVSIIQRTGEEDAIEQPKLASSIRRSSTKASMRCCGRLLKKAANEAAASEDRRRTLWGTLRI